MPLSITSSSDEEKYIDKQFIQDIDAKIATTAGAKTLRPLSRGAGQPPAAKPGVAPPKAKASKSGGKTQPRKRANNKSIQDFSDSDPSSDEGFKIAARDPTLRAPARPPGGGGKGAPARKPAPDSDDDSSSSAGPPPAKPAPAPAAPTGAGPGAGKLVPHWERKKAGVDGVGDLHSKLLDPLQNRINRAKDMLDGSGKPGPSASTRGLFSDPLEAAEPARRPGTSSGLLPRPGGGGGGAAPSAASLKGAPPPPSLAPPPAKAPAWGSDSDDHSAAPPAKPARGGGASESDDSHPAQPSKAPPAGKPGGAGGGGGGGGEGGFEKVGDKDRKVSRPGSAVRVNSADSDDDSDAPAPGGGGGGGGGAGGNSDVGESEIEYPDRPESPGVERPMPGAAAPAGRQFGNVTPDSTDVSDSDVRPRPASAGGAKSGGAGAGGKRVNKAGAALPDITPDSTERDDPSDSDAARPAPGSRPPSAPPPKPPGGAGRVGKDGRALPDITPDNSDAGSVRSARSAQPEPPPPPAQGGGGEVPRLGLGEGMRNGRLQGLDDNNEEGNRLFAGDETAPPALPAAAADGWMPLSSRMDLPNADSYLWENFSLSGLPKLAQELGSRKAWLKYKTEADFRQALRRNPNDLPTLHRYALHLYNKKKDIRLAEEMFKRCLHISEDYVEALIDYGVMCWLRWSMADSDRKDVLDKHQSERMLRKATKLVHPPGTLAARAYSKLGLFLDSALHHRDEAMIYFKKAAESDPSNPDHAHNLAVHYEEAGKMEEASKWYKAAIQANMLYAPALSNYARLLDRHYKEKEAAGKFHQRAVRAAPFDADICFNYALFLEEVMHHYTWAKDFYDRAVAANPKDPTIYTTAGQFYLRRLRDKGKCMDMYKRALRLDHEHVPSLVSYARFLEFDRKDPANASAYYQRAMEVKGADGEAEAEALSEAARFMQDRGGESSKAEEAFRRALERKPNQPHTLTLAATFFLKTKKDPQKAKAIFDEALARDLSNEQRFEVHLSYATMLEHDMDSDDHLAAAGEHYRAALKIHPNDCRAVAAYASLLASFYKDLELAEKYHRQAIKLEPKNSHVLLSYARFLWEYKNKNGEAEHYLDKAVKADPSSGEALLAYAQFLRATSDNGAKALAFYKQAAERAHDDAELHLDFAEFLIEDIPDYTELRGAEYITSAALAEEQLVLAVEAAPGDPTYVVALADFLEERGRRREDISQLYQQALRMDAERPETLGAYAIFLEEKLKDYDEAEQMYLRAITAAPREAEYLHNYATFLEEKRKQYQKAEEYFERAMEASPEDGSICRAYADLLTNHLNNKKMAGVYYAKAASLEAKQQAREGSSKAARRRPDDSDKDKKRRGRADPSSVPLLGSGEKYYPKTPTGCCCS